MKVIGLTGSIASGKSTVSKILKSYDIPVIDADIIARQVVEKGTVGLTQISEAFGRGILQADGSLNRKTLKKIIFVDNTKRTLLENIIHPLVEAQIDMLIKEYRLENTCLRIVLDVPLLFETGMDKKCDEVWLVICQPHTQIKRLVMRDGIDKTTAQAILSAQMPLFEKKKKADVFIDNNYSMNDLKYQVIELLRYKQE